MVTLKDPEVWKDDQKGEKVEEMSDTDDFDDTGNDNDDDEEDNQLGDENKSTSSPSYSPVSSYKLKARTSTSIMPPTKAKILKMAW